MFNHSKELPELKKRISHFMTFLNRTLNALLHGKYILVTNSKRKKRLEVCKGRKGNTKKNLDSKNKCKFLSKDSKYCTICGCNLSLKSRFKTDRCDIGKWDNIK
jgi:murein L,D-transpeptidase YafK